MISTILNFNKPTKEFLYVLGEYENYSYISINHYVFHYAVTIVNNFMYMSVLILLRTNNSIVPCPSLIRS